MKKIYFHHSEEKLKQIIEDVMNTFSKEQQEQMCKEVEEYNNCIKSPYYFATKYLTVNGRPFTTRLSEEEFNQYYKK